MFPGDLNFGTGFLDLRKRNRKRTNTSIREWQRLSAARDDFEKATTGPRRLFIGNHIKSVFNSRKIRHYHHHVDGETKKTRCKSESSA